MITVYIRQFIRVFWMFVGSVMFWRLTVLVFVASSVFYALLGRYSMAFDEYYHYEAIQAYAKTWLPWQIEQPTGPARLGALVADPSYLYHYIMSWPYRLFEYVAIDKTFQIVIFRLIDVGFVLASLVIFRKLLLRLGMSRAAVQLSLFVFILLPVTSLLAGQLNYDTLVMLMTAVTIYTMVELLKVIELQKKVPLSRVLYMLTAMILTCQVKYAFLPVVLGGGMYILLLIIWKIKNRELHLSSIMKCWRQDLGTRTGRLVMGVFVVSSVFFVMRYGGNVVQYGSFVPKCDAVLTREECRAFGPFERDDSHKSLGWQYNITTEDKLEYPQKWVNQMMYETYFAVGPFEAGYPVAPPLPIAYKAGWVMLWIGLFVLIVRARVVWRSGSAQAMIFCAVMTYTLVLYVNNYQAFVSTGAHVAIHGRYLVPLVPMIVYLVYTGLRTLPRWNLLRPPFVLLVAGLVLASLAGGSILPYAVGSSESWYWPSAVPFTNWLRDFLLI